jgi:hypothetical protein
VKQRKLLGILLAGILVLSGCAKQPSGGNPQNDSNRLSEHELVCLEYSSFTGAFPEDGTGRPVQSVAAMLIRNDSGKFLDYALVKCDIGTGTGTFKVTGLPAGKAVWVLEQDSKTVASEDKFAVSDCEDYSFRSDAMVSTDKLKVVTNGNTVTVTNVSGEALENVCIYYKSVHSDGNFFGGITYMLGFGTLEAGQTAQKQSSHFGEDSEIVRYSFQTAG